MKHRFKSTTALLPVETPKVGDLYHVSWSHSRGVVGRCISVNEENKTVILRKPKTKEPFKYPVRWSELRHTRKEQVKIIKQQNKSKA